MTIQKLIKNYPILLLFGMLTAVFSSPGQTFLVSLFIPHMQESFQLSKTQISAYYSFATLISACVLPLTGRLLDRMRLQSITLLAGLLLAFGCFLLSQSMTVLAVIIGFFLIRNLGQGTLTMISTTTMARIFGPMRGKALGIANLGYPFGEAIFPSVIAYWILTHGWRSGWQFLAVLISVLFIPGVLLLLWKDPHKKAQEQIAEQTEAEMQLSGIPKEINHWSVSEMLRDPRFYILILPVFVPPFFFTALFFHQLSFIEWKDWTVQIISASFIAFGAGRAVSSFLIGPVIDKVTAKKVFPFCLIPLAIGLLFLLFGQAPIWAFFYLGFSGMTMGIGMTVSSALYAELYGTRDLGAIRGIKSFLMVFFTAAAPISLGALLDHGVPFEMILCVMIGIIFAGSACAWIACIRMSGKKED